MFVKKRAIVAAIVVAFVSTIGFAQDNDEEKEIFSQLRHAHRINAHGDEFMSMDMSPDKQRLAIGTEKGDLIVWSIADAKLEKQFHEGRPIHQVAFNGNGKVLIAGGNHTGVHDCLFGQIDISTGIFSEWPGAGSDSLMYLSLDAAAGQAVTANAKGYVTAWEITGGKLRAAWDLKKSILGVAVAGERIFVSRSDIDLSKIGEDDEENITSKIATLDIGAPRTAEKIFAGGSKGAAIGLKFSPDKKILVAGIYEDNSSSFAFYQPDSGSLLASMTEGRNLEWISNNRFLISDGEEPLKFGTIDQKGKITTDEISKGGGFHGSGTPAGLSGQAVSADERYVWQTYEKIGALAEFDLKTKEEKLLIVLPPFPYAMDVREFSATRGYIATGGDDKFIRVWDLADLKLIRETATDNTPQGVAILPDGQHVVYSGSSSAGPTEIRSLDVKTGANQKLLTLDAPFAQVKRGGDAFLYEIGVVQKPASTDKKEDSKKPEVLTIKLVQADSNGKLIREYSFPKGVDIWATSHNGQWLAVVDNDNKFSVFDLANGVERKHGPNPSPAINPSKLAVTNDGNYVFTTEFTEPVKRWDVTTGEVKTIAGYRPVASSLNLSTDEKWAIVGGSHFDIGVYEIATGKTGFYTRVDASDFYVPQAWMKGNRLIYITDGGVMFDSILSK
jgi:WD40 repeat protein